MADIANLGFRVDSSGLRRAAGDLDRLNAADSRVTAGIAKLGAVAGASFAAVAAGTIAATNDLLRLNSELNTLSETLNISREALQLWQIAGETVGIDADKMGDIFKDVSDKLGDFASTGGGEALDLIKRLKLDINDLIAMSPDKALLKIADAMDKTKGMSTGEKTFLLESLADDASRLAPLLKDNAKALDDISRRASTNLVMITPEQKSILDEANKKMTEIGSSFDGLSHQAGTAGAMIVNAFGTDVANALDATALLVQDLPGIFSQTASDMAASWAFATDDMQGQLVAVGALTGDIASGIGIAFTESAEYARLGFTYFPVYAKAAFEAVTSYVVAWALEADAGMERFTAGGYAAFASVLDQAASAFGGMASSGGDAVAFILSKLADMAGGAASALSTLSNVPGLENIGSGVQGVESDLRNMAQAASTAGASVGASLSASADEMRNHAKASSDAALSQSMLATETKLAGLTAIQAAQDFVGVKEGQREINTQIREENQELGGLADGVNTADGANQKFRVNQTAVNKALSDGSAATTQAATVIHAHGDAMQQAAESITQRTLAVEHGTLAEQYYIERMKGVTDAEARRIVSGNQYLAYLEEQQSLTKDATAAHGGLLDAYRQKLDDAGLGSADKAFDAAKSSTDVAVDAAVKYRESIEAVTKAAKDAADAINNMSKAQPTSVEGGKQAVSAGTTAISGSAAATAAEVVSKLQDMGWGKNQAIGIAANLKQESEFRAGAVGDGGKAYGLAQWHPDRQANFSREMGRDIRGSSIDDQLKFLTYELTKGNERGAGNKLKGAESAAQSAAIVSRYYERPLAQAEEMTRRAGIANGIAKSLGDTVPTFRAVADESGKVAKGAEKATTAITAASPALTEAKSLTVEYGGAIENKVVTAQMRASLEQKYMNGEAQKLIDAADMQAEVIGKSGIAIRQNELDQKQFNATQQAGILNAESALAYAEEEASLRKELASIKAPGMAAQYAAGLSDKTLTKDQISNLTGLRMENQFQSNMTELDGRAEQTTMTADAYQRMTMERDGFTDAQIRGQMQWEAEVTRMEETRKLGDELGGVFSDGVSGGLKDMLHTGNEVLDQLEAKLIDSIMTSKAMESAFSNFGGGITSFFGFSDGGSFKPSSVAAYANGDSFHNSILTQPTFFRASGKQAVAGEAGAEAVMPLTASGNVRAMTPDGMAELPLTRIGGKLSVVVDNSVQRFADGGSFGAGNYAKPNASGINPVKINLNITNSGVPVKAKAEQKQNPDGSMDINVILEQIDSAQAKGIRTGNSQTAQALKETYNLRQAGY